MKMRHCGFVLLLLLFCLSAWGESLQGTFRLLKDSDGTTPNAGASIEITFHGSTFDLKAIQPGETFSDHGTYTVSGSLITMTFASLDKNVEKKFFSHAGGLLILPIKLFSDGPGASTWQAIVPGSGDGSGQGPGGVPGATPGGDTGGGPGTGAGSGTGTGGAEDQGVDPAPDREAGDRGQWSRKRVR